MTHADRRVLLGLIVAAVLVRGISAGFWRADAFTDPDAYVGIAEAIKSGAGFCTPGSASPTAYRPPLYPLLLSLAVTSEPIANAVAICVVNIGMAILCIATSYLGPRLIDRRLGVVTALIVIADPLLNRATSLAMTECAFTALTAVAVFQLCVNTNPNWRLDPALQTIVFSGIGSFLGLAALCRPTIWPFIGLVSLGMLIVQRRRCRQSVAPLGAMWLAIVLVVSPWVIRNQLVFGRPILTTTHGGYTLLLGNNPVFYDEVARQPWGTVWDGASLDRWQQAMLAEMDAELGPDSGEFAWDRWQAAKAWRHIQDDPAGFGWAVWYRVRSLWSLSPRGKGGDSLPRGVKWLVAGWYAALFALAIAGAVIWTRERQPGLWVLLLFIASIQGMHLVYWTDTRMRAPLHPVLALLAAVAIDRLWRYRRSGSALT